MIGSARTSLVMKPFKEIIKEEVIFQMEGETGPLTVAHQPGERVEDAKILISESSNASSCLSVNSSRNHSEQIYRRVQKDVHICSVISFRRGQHHTGVHSPEAL